MNSLTLIILFLFVIILSVLIIISLGKIFEKMHEPGGKVLIPFYNGYTIVKNIGSPGAGIFYAIVIFLSALLPVMSAFGKTDIFAIQGLLNIILLIMIIISRYKLAKAFDYGIVFALGLIFLSIVFIPILGFGNSVYIRNEHQ